MVAGKGFRSRARHGFRHLGHHNVDADVVASGVCREQKEPVPIRSMRQGVAAHQLAVLEAHRELLAVSRGGRSRDETTEILSPGISCKALNEEDCLQETAAHLDRWAAMDRLDVKAGAIRIEVLCGSFEHLSVGEMSHHLGEICHSSFPPSSPTMTFSCISNCEASLPTSTRRPSPACACVSLRPWPRPPIPHIPSCCCN